MDIDWGKLFTFIVQFLVPLAFVVASWIGKRMKKKEAALRSKPPLRRRPPAVRSAASAVEPAGRSAASAVEPAVRRRRAAPSAAPPGTWRGSPGLEAIGTTLERPTFHGHPILEAVVEEVAETLDRVRTEPGVENLIPALERGLLEPLRRISRGINVRPEIVEAYQRYWGLVRSGIEQRTGGLEDAREAAFVQDLDAIANAAREWARRTMSLDAGMPVRRLLPVLIPEGQRSDAHGLPMVETTGIAPVPVPRSALDETWRWGLVHHNLAHVLWEHQPGLQAEVARAAKLSTRHPSVFSLGIISEQNLVRFLSASWLPEIFADIVTAMALGPAAAEGMQQLFRGMNRRELTTIRSVTGPHGEFAYDPHPPPLLRFALVLRMLSQGPFEKEAEDAWKAWRSEHGEPDDLQLELPGQFGRPFPVDPFVDEVDRVADRLLSMRLRSIGRKGLDEFPGLALSEEDHRRIDRAAATRAPQLAARAPTARDVVVYGILSFRHHGWNGADPALRLLAHTVRGTPIEASARQEAAALAGSIAGEATMREVLRDAVVWREVLRPPLAHRPAASGARR